MKADHLRAVGTAFTYQTEDYWRGPTGRGIEICRFRARVSAATDHQFEYEVTAILSVENPLPGTTGRQIATGGMTFAYAQEQIDAGTLVLAEGQS